MQELEDNSNKLSKSLKKKGSITEKELQHFTIDITIFIIEFKKAPNLDKLYLLPKTHKRLENVPGRPVTSNCGTPTEKVSEFLDSLLKPVRQSSRSYLKNSVISLRKLRILVLLLRISSWLRQMLWIRS